MKTGANGFNDTGSAFEVVLKIILQAPMAHSDLTLYMSNRKVTHASRWEGLTTISRYMKDNGHGRGWVTILWNATSNWIFRLTLVEAQAAAAEWPRLSRPERFILCAVRKAFSFHLEVILFSERLVQPAAEILQRVLLNNILQVKRTHQLWNDEDVTTY